MNDVIVFGDKLPLESTFLDREAVLHVFEKVIPSFSAAKCLDDNGENYEQGM